MIIQELVDYNSYTDQELANILRNAQKTVHSTANELIKRGYKINTFNHKDKQRIYYDYYVDHEYTINISKTISNTETI